jgi:integrase
METWKIKPVFDRKKKATPEKSAKVEIEIKFSRTERKWISTDIELYSNQWDGEFVVRHAKFKQLNKAITQYVKKFDDIIKNIRKEGKDINLKNFNIFYNEKHVKSKSSFLDFAYDELQRRDLKWSTKRAHLIALEALKRSGVIKTFDDITPENIALFDRFIRREDPTRGQTTIHGYHKRIKPYINEALRLGLIEDTPYRVFKDKHGRYKTRQPLTMDELQSIRNIELNDRQLQKVRDQFIFQCYTGLSWVDLYMFDYDRCTVEHNGVAYIDGERIKTGTKFYTPILTPAMEILKKYDYKFTVPTVQSFNRSLKIIAELIGLKKPLTSHIARHTFATTVVLANGVPIETLSKMLGHTKVSVTQVYAKILNSSVEKHAEKLNSII